MNPLGDGGLRQGEADLWCTYAAVRTLRWLDRKPHAPADVAAFVSSRRNHDGGYAWQRGLPSDSWATYYCTQTLLDLGSRPEHPDRLGDWVAGVRDGTGGFAMTPGQSPDVWATYYATRTIAEALGDTVREPAGLAGWLAALQCADGGLTWQPGGSAADTRACYYGAHAWQASTDEPFPWRVGDLVAWLRAQQEPGGGFRFAPGDQACLWATFRAVRALDALGAEPADPAAAVDWIERRRLSDGGTNAGPATAGPTSGRASARWVRCRPSATNRIRPSPTSCTAVRCRAAGSPTGSRTRPATASRRRPG